LNIRKERKFLQLPFCGGIDIDRFLQTSGKRFQFIFPVSLFFIGGELFQILFPQG
jgi:hypothetical protein